MSNNFITERGIDQAVLLMFGGIVLILFVVVSAMGFGEIERSAEQAGNHSQIDRSTDRQAEIGVE